MEDMSYNHGPMLSGEQFETFLAPYYRQVIPTIKQHGTWVFVDSDGDITEPAPWFDAAGIDGILPLERQAGVDLAGLRKTLPHQRYIGAFDKMTMPKGRQAMEAEFQRLVPIARQGGFIISVDHQTPPGVSLENYRIYLDLLEQYARQVAR
jgi:uroporphyrinogen-III decarboxylase